MKLFSIGRLVGMVGLGCLAAGAARGAETGLFISADAGVNLLQDIDVDLGPPDGTVSFTFDPGFRAGVTVGYTVYATDKVALALGFETGLLYNSFDEGEALGVSVPIEGDYWQVPFLGKITAKFNPDADWSPYVGFGAGGVYSKMTIDSIGATAGFSSSDQTDPAIQAIVGLKYKLNDHSGLGIGYRYLMVFADGTEDVTSHGLSVSYAIVF